MFRMNAKSCLLVLLTALFVSGAARAQSDADLYYRRTHGGQLPPAGVNPADHSQETSEFAPAPAPAPPPKLSVASAGLLDHGIDPANLGKGDWIWQIPSCLTALGVANVQGLIDYEKARGMEWITVKCGDSGNIWSQFNTDLITRAHAAGLKIFGWAYVYGNNIQGEIDVALNALNLGADGFIIDAESEYETLANNAAAATQYCEGIRAAYPNTFLAHAPYPIISSHPGFPYITFGKYCNAVMPQAYWADIGGTGYMVTMVTRMNTEWRNWQNSLTGANTNAIKPLAPIGQGYNSVNGTVTGAAITTFVNALKTNTPAASAGGYKGLSFWSCQHHSADMWSAIGVATIGTTNDPPALAAQPRHRSVNQGTNVTFSASVVGASPLRYQWRFHGTNLPNATNAAFGRNNVQPAHAGPYLLVVTNAFGSVTSSVATLVVNVSPVWQTAFAENFEADHGANWNLFQGSGNGVSDYTADWAFDYSVTRYSFNGVTNFIPPAPNSAGGATRGLKLTVNNNDAVAATAGVSVYPKNLGFSNNYALRFDVWLNYNGPAGGGVGSTEFATFGLNHTGTRVNWTATGATAGDGVWFAMDGDGDAGSDYLAFTGNTSGPPSQLAFASGGLVANGALGDDAGDVFFQGLFPGALYETAGSPGKRWVQGELSQISGVLTWRLNGEVVAQRTNASPFTSGNVMLGYMDTFTSIANPAADNFVLFDNVRVLTAVEPPLIATAPTNRLVNAGANAAFAVTAAGSAPLAYQWRFNGGLLAGATNSGLTIARAQAGNAGAYSVVVTNLAGSATSAGATLNVTTLRLGAISATNGGWQLSVTGAPGPGYAIETSTNLIAWSLVSTLVNSNGTFNYFLPPAAGAQNFYRVRAPE